MKFNEKIVILRKRMGFSQEDLANELDVSRQSVYKWENGESIPDVNKIKKMVKLFNISFDNLLDDEFDITVEPNSDSAETKAAKSKSREYRPIFILDKVISSNQAEIDNNYKPFSKGCCSPVKMNLMTKKLEEYGADSHIPLQPDLAACFFQNSKNLTFGFYFDEEIQFVCPYENYIGSTVSKTGRVIPTPLFSGPSEYCLNISYFDENGNINEYVLPLSYDSGRSYVFYKYRKEGEAELFLSHIASCTSRHMDEIQNKLIPLTAIAEKIHSGETEVVPIDVKDLQDKARKPRSDEYYEEQNRRVENNSSDDFILALGVFFKVIIPIGLVILLIWYCFSEINSVF